MSHDIPVMVGTCRTEQSGFMGVDEAMDALTADALKKRLDVVQRGQGETLLAMYQRLYPKSSNAEILYMAATDRGYFLDSTILSGIRADAGGGKTWMYNFYRETPVDGGRYFAPHAEEIPFVFDSLAKGAVIAGPVTPEAQKLADQVSGLWASFARTGTPSAPGIPKWTPYNSKTRPTMVLNYTSHMENDVRSEQRKTMLAFGSQQEAYGRPA
jgi:para-nitrobenzyl esterase